MKTCFHIKYWGGPHLNVIIFLKIFKNKIGFSIISINQIPILKILFNIKTTITYLNFENM
jgi:hypothetical protein